MNPIISHVKFKNLQVSAYLDDIFICAQSEDILKSYVNIVNNLLNDLGFHINFEKSSIEPSHSTSRLYFELFNISISLPYDKIIKTRKFAYLIHNKYSLRETIFILGLVVSHSCAFKFSPITLQANSIMLYR